MGAFFLRSVTPQLFAFSGVFQASYSPSRVSRVPRLLRTRQKTRKIASLLPAREPEQIDPWWDHEFVNFELRG